LLEVGSLKLEHFLCMLVLGDVLYGADDETLAGIGHDVEGFLREGQALLTLEEDFLPVGVGFSLGENEAVTFPEASASSFGKMS
jgi:hypothetical protein